MALCRRANIDIPEKDLPPIFGLKQIRLVTIEEATKGLESKVLGLDEQVQWAKEKCKHPSPHGLTIDESAAIFLYTMEGTETSLYDVLNTALRQRQRSVLSPWLFFLKLFITGLEKCPQVKCNVWRGIKTDQRKSFIRDETFQWWSITSCSTRLTVVKDFLPAKGTLFMIEVINGRDISVYSSISQEQEIILAPGSKLFVVDNSLKHDTGLHVVHLKEIPIDQKSSSTTTTSSHTQQSNQKSTLNTSSNLGIVRRRIDLPQGGHYEGDVDSNGVYHGYGLLIDAEGKYYKGNFHQGRLRGQGIMEWPNGQRYEGEFQNGTFHGYGKMRYPNGDLVVGRWEDNHFCDTAAYFD